jgi:uncharacterized membrane protein
MGVAVWLVVLAAALAGVMFGAEVAPLEYEALETLRAAAIVALVLAIFALVLDWALEEHDKHEGKR